MFDNSALSERDSYEWKMKHLQILISDPSEESKDIASAFIIEIIGGP